MLLPRARLGRSGLEVSRLGLSGSFGLDQRAALRAFHELGVDYFFVTPAMRGLFAATRELIQSGHRERLIVATGANLPFGWSVRRAFEKAARELGTDRIDVFHLFWVQAHWYVTGKTWSEMQRLKQEGLVGALAISCHDRPMARALADELELDVLMLRYNAAHRGAESEVLASLPAERRPGVVAYTATRWGALLRPVSGLGPMSAPECYRFALSHPSVDVVLCGPRSFEELEADAAGVRQGPLDAERMSEVRRFGDAVRATVRGKIGFSGV
jgi:aryl-alcohol dehydrogenase-like predicted oxidoreductase